MKSNPVFVLQSALALLTDNRYAEAADLCEQVLAEDPDNADACFLTAMVHHHRGDDPGALVHIRRAIALQGECGDYHLNHGVILGGLGRDDEAEAAFRRALALHADDGVAAANLGRLLMVRGRAEEALPLFVKAVRRAPEDAGLLGDLGVVLMALRRLKEALGCYRRALSIDPGHAEVHFNYSRALLLAGDYRQGWRENEWRWKSGHYAKISKTVPHPLWDGRSLAGKRIVLIGEQGFGDTLQLARYGTLVHQRGGEVHIQCRPELVRLLKTVPGVAGAAPLGSDPPAADFSMPMFSLPLLFDTRLETVPARFPYLSVPSGVTVPEPAHRLIREATGLKIGLIWSGKNQRVRRLADFSSLLSLPGADFFTLQPGLDRREMAGMAIRDLGSGITDFADTAALMDRMDLIISIDTANAHLAGALGRPLWVLLHPTADWRWGFTGDHTSWYPAARLFRQKNARSWPETLAVLGMALREKLVGGG